MRNYPFALLVGGIIGVLTTGTVAQAASSPTSQFPSTPSAWPFVFQQTSSTVPVTSGVQEETAQFSTLSGPLLAHTLQIDLSNPNVKVGAVLANNSVYSKDESVSSMANRTHAVGGINGDFFEIGASGRPENLVMVDGQVLQSQLPGGYAVVGITKDGHVTIGPETFTGQVTVTTFVPPGLTTGSQTVTSSTYELPSTAPVTHSFDAVNRPGLEKGGNLVLYTPAMGSRVYVPNDTVAYLTRVNPNQNSYQVVSVTSGVKAIPALSNEIALAAGGGDAAKWVTTNLSPGDIVTLNESLSPDSDLIQAVGSGYQLLQNGQWYADPHALGQSNVDGHNPLTAVGVSRDGQHAFMVVFDGRNPSISLGLTYRQMANYLRQLGAWNAAMFDGGGSSEMVARMPGQKTVSVVNHPSDGTERQVADGLFVYSTEPSPGQTSTLTLNQGQPLSMMVGATTTTAVYGVDASGNPTADSISLSVLPANLANVQGNRVVALKAGQGQLVATTPSGITTSVPLNIVAEPATIEVQPALLTTVPGQTTNFSATALDGNGNPLVVPSDAISWSVSNPAIGSISMFGQFSAAPPTITASGRPSPKSGKVIVNIGSTSTQVPVQSGFASLPVDSMTQLSKWMLSSQADGKIFFNKWQSPPSGGAGSMEVHYDYPKGSGSEQVVFWPKQTTTLGPDAVGDAPAGLGLWIKGDHSDLNFAISLTSESGSRVTLYPTTVNFSGWSYVTVPFPAGLGKHVTVNFLDFLTGSPAHELKGNLFVSDLEALYATADGLYGSNPSTPTSATPSWFEQAVTPAEFGSDGTTLVAADGMLWNVQGDVTSAGLKGAKGIPVSGASRPANVQLGRTEVIVLNDNQGSYAGNLAGSDPTQSSPGSQFPWLMNTLSASTANTIIIAAANAAFSPVAGDATATIRQPDATALEQIVSTYQQSHPNVHVVLLFGSRSINSASKATSVGDTAVGSARFISPTGRDVATGDVVNLVTPTLSMPSSDGGPSGKASLLLHVSGDGLVSWIGLPANQFGSAAAGGEPARVR